MNIDLRIIKTKSGDDYNYDFNLWGDRVPHISCQRLIEGLQYDRFKNVILAIRDHISIYRNNLVGDPQEANENYRTTIERWLRDVSRMVKKEFLPLPNTAFAKAMSGIEQQARSGGELTLTISTNEYLIPWWLANSYTSDDPADLWNVLFSIGFVPTHITSDSEKTKPVTKPRIALISRPSSDLRNAADITGKFREAGLLSSDKIDIQNGSKNAPRSALGRFGLLEEEIRKSLSESQVLFYYGHFELDEKFPERSYLAALNEYTGARRESEIEPHPITLGSIKSLLTGKVLFLDACRSIGLPFLSDDPFPSSEKILPTFYLANKIICVGTIYPIFDDAAVDYITLFAKFLLDGYCIGEAIKKARRGLIAQRGYTRFDWAPYILVGNPRFKIQA